jgi:Flp pilus assembly protein TadG
MPRDESRWDGAGRDDDGAAAVEFLALTLVLLLPILYLVVAVTRVQAGAYAAEGAAYAAARAAVVTGLDALDAGLEPAAATEAARESAALAAEVVAEDFGIGAARVELDCDAQCLSAGSTVRARVEIDVALPGVPAFVSAVIPARVTLDATAASPVDGYVP